MRTNRGRPDPAGPTNVTAAPYSDIQITVRFTSATSDLTDFGVLVMDAQSHAIKQVTVPAHDTLDYQVEIEVPETLETAVGYCFKLGSHHLVAGWSGWSSTACTTMPPVPAAPSSVDATVNGTTVHLQWTDNFAIETVYEVFPWGC